MNNNTKMPIIEHIEELRHRVIKAAIFLIIITSLSFSYTKELSFIIQEPAVGVKFLQLSPGEYFFSSIKISGYTGLLISSPFIIYQITLFILPGLTKQETDFFIPTIVCSILLFFLGVYFAFKILIPAALHFLIDYGADIVEPIWSFEQYFNFILILLISTGVTFQVPIIQIIIGMLKIVSSKQMASYWRYILLLSTVISAILTPSTDPVTQILLSVAILSLYSIGVIILKLLDK